MVQKSVPSWSKFLEILKGNEYRFKRTDVKKGEKTCLITADVINVKVLFMLCYLEFMMISNLNLNLKMSQFD